MFGKITCSKCGATSDLKSKFCLQCGSLLLSELVCSNCGRLIETNLTDVIFKVFSISNEVVNKIIKLVLDTLEKEIKSLSEIEDKIRQSGIWIIGERIDYGLIFSCLSILDIIADYNKKFTNYRLNMENYQQFLKIVNSVEKSENKMLIERVLRIKKDLIKP